MIYDTAYITRWWLTILPALACLPCMVSAVGAWAIIGGAVALFVGALAVHVTTVLRAALVLLAAAIAGYRRYQRAAMLRTTQSL